VRYHSILRVKLLVFVIFRNVGRNNRSALRRIPDSTNPTHCAAFSSTNSEHYAFG